MSLASNTSERSPEVILSVIFFSIYDVEDPPQWEKESQHLSQSQKPWPASSAHQARFIYGVFASATQAEKGEKIEPWLASRFRDQSGSVIMVTFRGQKNRKHVRRGYRTLFRSIRATFWATYFSSQSSVNSEMSAHCYKSFMDVPGISLMMHGDLWWWRSSHQHHHYHGHH